jgi:hypothetical protein
MEPSGYCGLLFLATFGASRSFAGLHELLPGRIEIRENGPSRKAEV